MKDNMFVLKIVVIYRFDYFKKSLDILICLYDIFLIYRNFFIYFNFRCFLYKCLVNIFYFRKLKIF